MPNFVLTLFQRGSRWLQNVAWESLAKGKEKSEGEQLCWNCVSVILVLQQLMKRALFLWQGLLYHHYELGKNSDPSKEPSEELKKALTVHPVSDPEQMYRLHRYFTEIELQKTYDEIAKLQVNWFSNVSYHPLYKQGHKTANYLLILKAWY